MAFGVENNLGLLALLSLIPFIILYLIRPKPKELDVPSLMFFMKSYESKQRRSFLKMFSKDLLFLIQLLILIFASLTVADPYALVNKETVAKNLVLVLDVSASMNTKEADGTRLDKAIEIAKENLGSSNTLILVKSFPVVGLEEKGASEARKFLDNLKPTDSRSKIGDAMLLAGEVLGKKNGKVVVISDFINTDGTPPETAKNVLESKGFVVKMIDVADDNMEKNVGILGMDATEDSTTILIKNYDNEPKKVKFHVNNNENEISLSARTIEPYKFVTPKGITKIQLDIDDGLNSDNVVYLSSPEDVKIKVQLITNSKSLFLKSALQAYKNVELTVSEPPVIDEGDYDVYVFDGVDPSTFLTGTSEEIAQKVKNGASAIIHVQNNIRNIDYGELLPVTIKNEAGFGVLEIVQSNVFTKDVEFGKVDKYFDAEIKDGVVPVVNVGNSSIIALGRLGKGKIAYYGISEDASDFKLSPFYPIFWTGLVKFLTDKVDIRNLNFKTGDPLVFGTSLTPLGFDYVGVYEVGGLKLAVNLLSDLESDINKEHGLGGANEDFIFESEKEKTRESLSNYLLYMVILFLLLELFYIKRRGDL